jgi:hypothetical protein
MKLAMSCLRSNVVYSFSLLMNPVFKLPFFCLLVSSVLFGCNGNQFSSGNEDWKSDPFRDGEISFDSDSVLISGNLEIFLVGRNGAEIKALFGVPREKGYENDDFFVWRYRRAVFDEATSTIYGWSRLTLKFKNGLCSKIFVDLEHPPIPVDDNTEVNTSLDAPKLPLFRKF